VIEAIAVATHNKNKLRELIELWGPEPPALVPPPESFGDVAEIYDTYEANALLKARSLADAIGSAALADDSGIEVEALGWGPGVVSARTPSLNASWQERNAYILSAVAGARSRRARFVCVCALVIPGAKPIVARGEVLGLIAAEARGSNGFGYDPIFIYPPYRKTFAEVSPAQKHAVSHRGRAVRNLRALLSTTK
jgi:XTP/dITP diphosphohydrolase